MSTPVYFNNTSPGFTALANTAGSLTSLLDTLLVEAGWSIAFTNGGGVRVYRNNPLAEGSSGCYVRIDNTSWPARMKVFKTMSDVDTGTDMIPTEAAMAGGTWLTTPTVALSSWQFIGDDRTFYFNLECSTIRRYIFGAGDYNSERPGDTLNYFCAGLADTSVSAFDSFVWNSGAPSSRTIPRDLSNNPDTQLAWQLPVAWAAVCKPSAGEGPSHLISPITGKIDYQKAAMYTAYGFCGTLRGCYIVIGAHPSGLNETIPANGDFSVPLRVFGASGGSPGYVNFTTEDWE